MAEWLHEGMVAWFKLKLSCINAVMQSFYSLHINYFEEILFITIFN